MASDRLEEYNSRRDFSKTREPKGTPGTAVGNRFVVQKHDATRLHYDLRLEMDGVLKSWAITRGPSLDPDDKRLAVRTEDHPLSYRDFEGNIAKGSYGGGTVMLWDRGTWEPVPGKAADDLDEGHLHFILHGERMKGEWLLVRMGRKPKEKRENWLLRKIADRHAGSSDALTARELTSVKTGGSMAEIAAGRVRARARPDRKPVGRKPAKGSAPGLPRFRQPQLATLVESIPDGDNWLHEIKYDGYRAMLAIAGTEVKIYTRSGLDWTQKFAGIARAAGDLAVEGALIDGEIVALDTHGNPNFGLLQARLAAGESGFVCFAFDLLELDGTDQTTLPQIERTERLAALLGKGSQELRLSDHVIGAGQELYQALCHAGQEGIISKRMDARYLGGRGLAWLKTKCIRREEFVIIGWSESSSRGRPFASLLLGQRAGGALVYQGKVGTGFDQDALEEIGQRLSRLERKTAPADVPGADAREAHWVTPKLVAEVAFGERTAEGRLRHASFIALRTDKDAAQVTPDVPVETAPVRAAFRSTNRDRIIFPDAGLTKGDLADYYQAIALLMLPWAANRPLSLVRCPQGRTKKCFFQRHDNGSFGEHVHHTPIREKDGGTAEYLFVKDAAGISACIQMGTIEFHGWGARVGAIEQVDRMVFDLDPDEGLDFDAVRQAAGYLRSRFTELGLVCFAMLSGGKGIHVVVPLNGGPDWDMVNDFASRFARALTAQRPRQFTATMSKAKRKEKIFIDWHRNQRGATSVIPYSVRARNGAPVAAPIAWSELDEYDSGDHFALTNLAELTKRATGLGLRGWGRASQRLPEI